MQSVTFEQIVPHIVRVFPEQKSQIPYYKEAFDILRHMEYAENGETIPVEWVREEDEEPYIHIDNCEGDYWESNLGKRLEIATDVQLSDAELAARCLWSLTFYQFSPDDDTKTITCLIMRAVGKANLGNNSVTGPPRFLWRRGRSSRAGKGVATAPSECAMPGKKGGSGIGNFSETSKTKSDASSRGRRT